MEEQFVPYDIANTLIDKGFKEDCLGYYEGRDNNLICRQVSFYELEKYNLGILAPLWQQVIDWFEDKFNLKFSIAYWNGYNNFLPKAMQYKYEVYIIPENAPSITVRGDKGSSYFDTRKDAITAAILKALTLI